MRRIAVALIACYQLFLSPLFPRTCRFYPSCSHYAREAIEEYGLWRGGARALARILRCHPFHPGGYDPVPARVEAKGQRGS